MALAGITRSDVLEAIAEYQKIGRDGFLAQYGFGEARRYLLVHEAAFYDSKAILGVAHRFSQGSALKAEDFSGGEQHAVQTLRRLGFEIRSSRNPPWVWDELVLACDLVAKNEWRSLNPSDLRVSDLSDLLQRLPIHPPAERGDKFRNPNGVGRKTADIATQHPDYRGKSTNGGALDRPVLDAFLEDPARMHAIADEIRAGIASGVLIDLPPMDVTEDEDLTAPEGRLLVRRHLLRERDRKLRAKKIAQSRKSAGELACEACGFNFERTYGSRGTDYIECHHIVPLHASGETRTRLQDLALICANCHRMIHRSAPWPTPIELRDMIAIAAKANPT